VIKSFKGSETGKIYSRERSRKLPPDKMKRQTLHPVHPGEVLLEEFLNPLGLSQNKLAVNIGVPARRINEIVLEKRKVTADTALRLGRFFGMSSGFWLGLQSQYDLDIASDALGDRLEKEVKEYSKVA
jgi:addiction module HigA family antidote